VTDELSFQDFLHELSKVRGLDFRGYKYNSLERRLRKRMSQIGIHTYGEYLEYFHRTPDEITVLLQTVLINVTSFFRDPPAWQALRRDAFPVIFDKIKPGGTIRAWCAGCASGEEVYSLAILLLEHFGPQIKEYELKLYATDHDEAALEAARRAEYPAERVRNMPLEWKDKYFQGGKILRLNRDLRRMVIFGRSNLVSDAPISHVNLLICRNVLIYFDLALQRHVLQRFRYALEENGVLFLGKSESLLRDSQDFRCINPKWRLFQCTSKNRPEARLLWTDPTMDKIKQEVERLRTIQSGLLATLRQAVIILDSAGVVRLCNDAAKAIWGTGSIEEWVGKPLEATAVGQQSPDLIAAVIRARVADAEPVKFQLRTEADGEDREIAIVVRPILDRGRKSVGTLIYAEDVSHQERLRTTIEELESTAEELHSANGELETTNEELQSTNEELETTNEELQSTNEELETTNEELHSLNEELETTNDELEMRTRELDEINRRYAETLEQMPSPIVVVNEDNRILLWNSAAQKLFGHDAKGAVGMHLEHLPISSGLRSGLLQRLRTVVETQRSASITVQKFKSVGFNGKVAITLSPVNSPTARTVLIIFDATRAARVQEPATGNGAGRNGARAKKTAVKKSSAAKDGKPRK
jgi:two-component system CheB/CheR fusion protein